MPLSNEDIQEVLVRYEREYDRYAKLTEYVYERCLRIVDMTGVRATVQRRTKASQSLRNKLLRIQRRVPADPRFRSVEDVFNNMSDLAAVRISPYLEADRTKLVSKLQEAFEFGSGDEQHPNPDEKSKFGRALHYRAIHCQVLIKGEDLVGANANLARTSCEIQVCSMLAHVWNEIEHDLGYKPATGGLSERELDCLDALGQLVRAGDVLIKTLLDANQERVAAIETPFNSHHDFATRMQVHFPAATNFHDHAAQLFDVLLDFGLDSPSKIREALLSQGYQARAEKLLSELSAHIKNVGTTVLDVESATSDQLAVLLLDKKLDELLERYPTGRGMGRPMRLVSMAKRFDSMRKGSGTSD
jgi:ppGpp synthetase/RelA/SpoT-type nucleotidyltranferase